MILVSVKKIDNDNMISKVRKVFDSIFANVRCLWVVKRSDIMGNIDQPKFGVDTKQSRFDGPCKVVVVTDIRGQG